MLGQPVYFLTPDVVGVNLKGALPEGVTATDLVLTVTEMLRKQKVVGKFVEFFGEGAASLSVPDRATIGNMAPEYGATMGFFPVDDATVDYLRATGRTDDELDAFEATSRRRACSACRMPATSTTARRWRWTWPRSPRRWPVPSVRRTASSCRSSSRALPSSSASPSARTASRSRQPACAPACRRSRRAQDAARSPTLRCSSTATACRATSSRWSTTARPPTASRRRPRGRSTSATATC